MQDIINNVLDFLKNHKFSEAIKTLNNIILNDQNNYNLYHLRGICYLKLSEYEKAKKDFEKTISLRKNLPEVYNNLGFLYFTIGQNKLAIENFLTSIEIKSNFERGIFGLIKSLSHSQETIESNSIFITKHNELNKIKINYSKDNYIENSTVENLLNSISETIDNNFINLKFNNTQIYRRSKSDLDCNRHKKVFNTYQIIPEFCFGCYKVQISSENLIDFMKVYLIFDNIELENHNTRKSMVETRPKMNGNYKSLIYCSSIEEAENIKDQILKISQNNLNKVVNIKVKRGCTEYGMKYPEYDNLEGKMMNFKPDWKNYENLIDNNFPDLKLNRKIIPTIKGISLNDALVIQNWLKYANLIGDETCKNIKSYFFKNDYLENKLKLR